MAAESAANMQESNGGRIQANSMHHIAGRDLMLECATPDLGLPAANIWLWFKNDQPIEFSIHDDENIHHDFNANNVDINNKLISISSGSGEQQRIATSTSITGHNVSTTTPTGSTKGRIIELEMANRESRNSGQIERFDSKVSSSSSSFSPSTSPMIGPNGDMSDNIGKAQSNGPNKIQFSSISRIKLLQSGRYLYIPEIQLNHKGNYTCVAVNRLGSSVQNNTNSNNTDTRKQSGANNIVDIDNHNKMTTNYQPDGNFGLRDTFQLSIAQAPTLVGRLPAKIYWSEPMNKSATATAGNNQSQYKLELSCHVECDPMCHLEWLRNGQPIDIATTSTGQPIYYEQLEGDIKIGYEIKNMLMAENAELNKFSSLQSKLIIHFPERKNLLKKVRNLLSGSNFTCSSSPNPVGPSAESTGILVIQCKYLNLELMKFCLLLLLLLFVLHCFHNVRYYNLVSVVLMANVIALL